MSEQFQDTGSPQLSGNIWIVDDDPVVAGMLGITLESAGHRITEASSGEELLALAAKTGANSLADILILDIELGTGIDGYETCRRLQTNQHTRAIPVIFLSGHDSLDDRLRAYDAGGNDFVAKPFVPEELLKKVAVALNFKRQHEAIAQQNRYATATAMTAISSLGESGATIKFSRGALACHTLQALAHLTIETMQELGLDCHIQLRTPTTTLTLSRQGPASQLEESVIEKAHSMGRIFNFRNRLIVNYDNISLLITNMPLEDEALCGRVRDHASMIAESADQAVDNINLRLAAHARTEDIRKLATASRNTMERLRKNYVEQQVNTRFELEHMLQGIENLCASLDITEQQEQQITQTLHESVERVLALFALGAEFDQQLAQIVSELDKAGNMRKNKAP